MKDIVNIDTDASYTIPDITPEFEVITSPELTTIIEKNIHRGKHVVLYIRQSCTS